MIDYQGELFVCEENVHLQTGKSFVVSLIQIIYDMDGWLKNTCLSRLM